MATPPDFTGGQILTAAQMNSVGMWLVKSDTISGATKTITAAFSDDFLNYKMVLSGVVCSSDTNIYLQMGTTATSIYYYAGLYRSITGNTVGVEGSATTKWLTGMIGNSSRPSGGVVELQLPFAADETNFQCLGADSRTNGAGGSTTSGWLNNNTSYTSFTLSLDGAVTFSAGTVKIYGYTD